MIYIKLEENRDKFLEKYQNLPKTMRKIVFQSKTRNGKFRIEKQENRECIILPCVNEKVLRNLKKLSKIRCWKTICISDNLLKNEKFMEFSNQNEWKIADGKWLFKNMTGQVVEYLISAKNETMEVQEISILCNRLDETIVALIKEMAEKVKVLNILTNHMKQFQKLEEDIYQTNGMIINVSNNDKKLLMKSNIVINFDFLPREMEKCNFSKNTDFINFLNNYKIVKKGFAGKNIVNFEVVLPIKYKSEQEFLNGFNAKNIYESLIYKNTSYANIKKEIEEDHVKIMYLEDCDKKIIKTSQLNFLKTLDKIPI